MPNLAYDAASNFIAGPRAVLNFPLVDYEQVEPPRRPPEWVIESCSELAVETMSGPPSLAFERYVLRNQKPDTLERHIAVFSEEELISSSFHKNILKDDDDATSVKSLITDDVDEKEHQQDELA